MNPLVKLTDVVRLKNFDSLSNKGMKLGQLYTNHGLPLDIIFDKVRINNIEKIAMLFGAHEWLIIHKRQSGASEAAIDRQRKANSESITRFINKGEVGIY